MRTEDQPRTAAKVYTAATALYGDGDLYVAHTLDMRGLFPMEDTSELIAVGKRQLSTPANEWTEETLDNVLTFIGLSPGSVRNENLASYSSRILDLPPDLLGRALKADQLSAFGHAIDLVKKYRATSMLVQFGDIVDQLPKSVQNEAFNRLLDSAWKLSDAQYRKIILRLVNTTSTDLLIAAQSRFNVHAARINRNRNSYEDTDLTLFDARLNEPGLTAHAGSAISHARLKTSATSAKSFRTHSTNE